jgi:hypothetical protein
MELFIRVITENLRFLVIMVMKEYIHIFGEKYHILAIIDYRQENYS